MQVHGSMDQTWMKVPIGSSGYVQGCLKKKLAELSALVEMISNMPARHEAFSILRSCASNCKIVHLTRTVPPKDSIPFVNKFDSILRKGFESILGHDLEERWWRIARLPVKYGGVGLRSGANTCAAQYAQSVMMTEHHVKNIAGQDYSAKTILERDAKDALERALGEKEGETATVDLDELLENGGRAKVDKFDLSLAQRCEAAEYKRILALETLTEDERLHVLAHSGKDHHWLRVAWQLSTPLRFCDRAEAPLATPRVHPRLRARWLLPLHDGNPRHPRRPRVALCRWQRRPAQHASQRHSTTHR